MQKEIRSYNQNISSPHLQLIFACCGRCPILPLLLLLLLSAHSQYAREHDTTSVKDRMDRVNWKRGKDTVLKRAKAPWSKSTFPPNLIHHPHTPIRRRIRTESTGLAMRCILPDRQYPRLQGHILDRQLRLASCTNPQLWGHKSGEHETEERWNEKNGQFKVPILPARSHFSSQENRTPTNKNACELRVKDTWQWMALSMQSHGNETGLNKTKMG